jgi:hypothetical protein
VALLTEAAMVGAAAFWRNCTSIITVATVDVSFFFIRNLYLICSAHGSLLLLPRAKGIGGRCLEVEPHSDAAHASLKTAYCEGCFEIVKGSMDLTLYALLFVALHNDVEDICVL